MVTFYRTDKLPLQILRTNSQILVSEDFKLSVGFFFFLIPYKGRIENGDWLHFRMQEFT